MTNATFVASRALSLDGTAYTISLYQSGNRFLAFWECEQCGQYARADIPLASEQETVIEHCETLIEQHHASCHERVFQGQASRG
jgi:hypothetical protein